MKMRHSTLAAILDPVFKIHRVAAAILHAIHRTVAEQTVEVIGIVGLMTRKILAGAILYKPAETAFGQTFLPLRALHRICAAIDQRSVRIA